VHWRARAATIARVIAATGSRIGWDDLPAAVRAGLEDIAGGPVVEAVSQPGGFSPGVAARVRTVDGRRAFVKAVSPAQNEETPALHRREADVTAALPPGTPAPRLLGTYDDGEWIALVLQDVEGGHPATPWRRDELDAVLRTLDEMATVLTPSPVADLSPAARVLAYDFGGWDRVAGERPADLDPWVAEHLADLRRMAARGLAVLDGDTMVHLDVRADNLLIGPDGRVTVVDWPWACAGPRWLDRLLLLVNVRLFGGHDTEALLLQCAAASGADVADLRAVLAGLAGYFVDKCRAPAPPGLPTVRGFQRAQGDALVTWLAETT
jgi:aminoglycoside phosphotransferase (APT) family kinase protein